MLNTTLTTRITVCTLILTCFTLFAAAQNKGTLTGHVLDTARQPLNGVTISVRKAGVELQTFTTNSAGYFSAELPWGTYSLSFSAVGFLSMISDSLSIDELHPRVNKVYTLRPVANLLQNISVTAKRPFIEQKIDRTVVNVDALVSNAGVTALDVLENAPGVLVSSDGAISLKGKSGVVIFIDDKPTYLSGADLANYLKSLPSGTLDRIEIMPNPPARYDAAGNAGVINIRTKKNRAAGFNGGVNLAYNQGRYARTNNSVNFNFRKGKMNAFGTASYAINDGMNDLDIYRYYYNPDGTLRSTFFQNSFIRNTSYSSNLKIGLDYFITPKTTIGLLVNGILRPSDSRTVNTSIVANANGVTDSLITANNKEHDRWKKGSVNLNLLHRYNSDKELSFDLDYITYVSHQDQFFINGIYDPRGNPKSSDALSGNLPSDIQIYSAKTDYSHTLASNLKWEAGAKVSYVTTDNAANYFTIFSNVTEPDYDKTNHFLYKETISAAYLNLNKDWTRWSIQAGLRSENTVSDGHQLGNQTKRDSSFRRSYINLFPTFYALYKLDSVQKHQISFSFGRRIERPFYQDLNPFISPLDKFSIYVGNPYLRPTFTNSFELGHIYKNKITTTLSFSTTADIVEETIDLANSIYISRPANIGKSTVTGLSVSGSLKPVKWWTTNLYAEVQNRTYKGVVYDYALDTSSLYFGTNITNQFVLGKRWTAELSGNFRTGILVGQIISSSTGRVNAGIAKKIFSDKGSLKLNFRDIFHTGLNHGIITSIKGAYATYHNWGDTRNVTLSLNYNFGRSTSGPRTRNSGAETEQNRVK